MATRFRSAAASGPGSDLVAELASQWQGGDGGAPALVFLFASPSMDLAALARRAHERFPGAAIVSSTTSGEFTERGETRGGGSAVAIGGEYRAFGGLGRNLRADPEGAVQQALAGLPRTVEGFPHCTAFLVLDALAGTGEEATLLAAELLGPDAQIAGAAAGDDLAMASTTVGFGPDVATDAVSVTLLFSREPLGVGVSHAHAPISPPLRVTRAEGSVVHTIEDRPAWDVWREHTRERAAANGVDVDKLTPADVGGHLLRYEAGLAAGDSTYKIRAPLALAAGGAISFACGIPTGSVIRVTESSRDGQRTAAESAAQAARGKLGGKAAGAVVFDCICRRLILDKEFEQAVMAIGKALDGAPMAGFETYGEIAMRVGDLSGFHNTTSVVVAFPE
jgi:methyl-accepting chemotaxis protein